ncbi:MAG: nitroreductase, partial [Elusimicrobia bacterium]|nr:nitroreductase [Elusimicrobiota bacterium]
MKFLDLITKRKSIRSYASRPVARNLVEQCIEAARLAPSACNSQPWHFIILDDPIMKNKVARAAFTGIYSMNAFAEHAPVLIIIVTERSVYSACLGGLL